MKIGDLLFALGIEKDQEFQAVVVKSAQKAGDAAGATIGERLAAGLRAGAKAGLAAVGAAASAAAGLAGKGLGALNGAVNQASDAVFGFTKRVIEFGLVAGGALAFGLRSAANGALDYYRAAKRVSDITGLNITESSKWLAIFQRFGIDGEEAAAVIAMLNKNVGNLTINTKTSSDFTKQWGFELRDANGDVKDTNALILQAADYFTNKNIPATQKAALEAHLFGRNWQALVPILALGSKGITDAATAAEKLGLVLSPQNAADLAAYGKATKDLHEAMTALRLRIGILVAPYLTRLVALITDHLIPVFRAVVTRVNDWVEAHKPLFEGLKSLFGLFGDWVGVLRGSWIPSISTIVGKIGAWIAANKPLIDQIRVFTGSVIATGIKTIVGWFKKLGDTGPKVAALVGAILLINGAIRANPIVAFLTAIVVAVGLLRTAWENNWGDIRNTVQKFTPVVQDVVDRVQTAFKFVTDNVVPAIGKAFDWLATNALPILQGAFRVVTEDVIPAFGGVVNWLVTSIWPPLQSILNTAATVWVPALQEAFKGFATWLSDNWPTISSIIGKIGDTIKAAFEVAADAIRIASPVLVNVGEVVIPAIGAAVSTLLEVVDRNFPLIQLAAVTALTLWTLAAVGASVATGVTLVASTGLLIDKLGLFLLAIDPITVALAAAVAVWITDFGGVRTQIQGMVSDLLNFLGIKDLVENGPDRPAPWLPPTPESFTQWLQDHPTFVAPIPPGTHVLPPPTVPAPIQSTKPMPVFAEGTLSVPRTGPAFLHAGELVAPTGIADALRRFFGGGLSGLGMPAVAATTNYNLNVTGALPVDAAKDAITELRRLAGITK